MTKKMGYRWPRLTRWLPRSIRASERSCCWRPSGALPASTSGDCGPPGWLTALLAAAGVRCSQRLGDLAAILPTPDEVTLMTILGAEGQR